MIEARPVGRRLGHDTATPAYDRRAWRPCRSRGRSPTTPRERPHDPALTCGDVTLSWEEFDRSTNRLARAFAEHGVQPGDLVTIALPNSHGVLRVGVRDVEAGRHTAARVGQAARPRAGGDRRAGRFEARGRRRPRHEFPHRATVPVGLRRPTQISTTASSPTSSRTFWKAPTSGGSTGRPKIILATAPGVFDIDAPGFSLPANSACVIPGVLYHNAPFSISSLALIGGNHVVNFPRFVPEHVLDAVTAHRPKYLYLVPTMMTRIWKLPDEVRTAADLSSLEVAVHMAAPCPPWLKEEWIDWVGPDVLCELYAGTEVQAITWITGARVARAPRLGRPADRRADEGRRR